MAVHGGGRLEQHLPDVVGHSEHGPDGVAYGWTSIRTVAGSMVSTMVRSRQVSCPTTRRSLEHPGFAVSARTPPTGPSRPSRTPSVRFWVGVQWHPETATTTACSPGWSARRPGGRVSR